MRRVMMSALLTSFFLTACGKGGEGDSAALGASDEEVLAAIDGYDGWSNAPSWPGIVAGEGPHGAFVQIWWNDVALDALDAGEAELPVGAVLVKESYADEAGASLNNVTVMWKAEAGAWTWARLGADGAVADAGALTSCSDCHSSGKDFVRSETW
jgi:hypothetical protein